MLNEVELDVEIQQSATGPVLIGITSGFNATQLFPNTATRVGFVLPSTVEDGSIWSVKLCTQLGSNGSQLLKEPREAVLDDVFVVGENITGGGEEEEENPSEI